MNLQYYIRRNLEVMHFNITYFSTGYAFLIKACLVTEKNVVVVVVVYL